MCIGICLDVSLAQEKYKDIEGLLYPI